MASPVVTCPTCQRKVAWSADSPFRPFCSERCRLIDLGAWVSEQRGISGDESLPGDGSLAPDGESAPDTPRATGDLDRDRSRNRDPRH